MGKEIQASNATLLINRSFDSSGNNLHLRELIKNAQEAGATRMEFGVEWQAVEKLGVYRQVISDNGRGMSADEMHTYFSTVNLSSKATTGDSHDNFGLGLRTSTYPWNPEGVTILSLKDGKHSMIRALFNYEKNTYELFEWVLDEEITRCVIDPFQIGDYWNEDDEEIDWRKVFPSFLTDAGHGTVIVLHGSKEFPNSIDGIEGEGDTKDILPYINTRFIDLNGLEVVVTEINTSKENYPKSLAEATSLKTGSRPSQPRTAYGALHYLTKDFSERKNSDKGKLAARGTVMLCKGKVEAAWYLWEGERPSIETYAKKFGYIAVRYGDELFEMCGTKTKFRNFGISEVEAQKRVTIILTPQKYYADKYRWGVHPEQTRTHLVFTGDGEKGARLPVDSWGTEFSQNMPEEIFNYIQSLRTDQSGTLNDDYRERLASKLGGRWGGPTPVPRKLKQSKEISGDFKKTDDSVEINASNPQENPNPNPRTRTEPEEPIKPPTQPEEPIQPEELLPPPPPPDSPNGEIKKKPGKVPNPRGKKSMKTKALSDSPDGKIKSATTIVSAEDVPRWFPKKRDQFDSDWATATWIKAEQCIWLNQDGPLLQEAIKYHQDKYPDDQDEIKSIVESSFGEILCARVAHARKYLLKKGHMSTERLDSFLTEETLTVSVMGLLAEESLISQRLGRIGKKTQAERIVDQQIQQLK